MNYTDLTNSVSSTDQWETLKHLLPATKIGRLIHMLKALNIGPDTPAQYIVNDLHWAEVTDHGNKPYIVCDRDNFILLANGNHEMHCSGKFLPMLKSMQIQIIKLRQ